VRRLHEFIRSLGKETMLTSVCTGSWVSGRIGPLDGLAATNRKKRDKVESSKVPIDRLANSRPRAGSAGRAWSTPSGSSRLDGSPPG